MNSKHQSPVPSHKLPVRSGRMTHRSAKRPGSQQVGRKGTLEKSPVQVRRPAADAERPRSGVPSRKRPVRSRPRARGMYRKKHSNSPLNRVSADRAAKIVHYARTHTIARTVAWLARKRVKTSIGALSRWLSTQGLRESLLAAEEHALEFRNWMAVTFPDICEEELDRRANLMFQFEAVKCRDPKTYLAFSTARHRTKMDRARFEQRERALALAREKWLASQRTKIEAGLDALYREVKHNAEARDLFQKFKAVATKATT
jgi:hypothetical protein